MINSLNYDSKSVFLPNIKIQYFSYNIPIDLTNQLIQVIEQEESNILATTNKPESEKDPTWLTGRLWEYNLLKFTHHECIKELQNHIRTAYIDYLNVLNIKPESCYIQCWANILRNDGRRITPHSHASAHAGIDPSYSYVSGNLTLRTNNTNTYYHNPFIHGDCIGINNIPGNIIVFPSYVIHHTDVNKSEQTRISIAFDIITKEVYELTKNQNFIEL
jgi:hypothetical protein